MTETEVKVAFAELQKEIGSLKHRMNDVEQIVNVFHQLTQEMVGLTKEVSFMNHNLTVLTAKVAEIERKPEKRWESIVAALLAADGGAIAGTYL